MRPRPPRRGPSRYLVAALLSIGIALVASLALCGTRDGDSGDERPPPAAAVGDERILGTPAPPAATATPVDPGEPPAPPSELARRQRALEPATGEAPFAVGVAPPEISAEAAIVLDGASLAVLYERNAHERRAPASLTKIATAILVAERADLEDVATSGVHHWDLFDSTSMGLIPGDQITLRDLMYGLMLVSGNDAGQVLAEHIAGSEAAFVDELNALMLRLGLEDTRFENPHGLIESSAEHYSTAYELALLSRHYMGDPVLREVAATEQIIVTAMRQGEPFEFDLFNNNPLLEYTPGVDGIKTGYTDEAGRTFAVSVEQQGRRLHIVLLDAATRAQDAIALIEWAYQAHVWEGG